MKVRIVKKLSKRLVKLAPTLFRDAWVDTEVMDSAWDQGSRVSHVLSVGGGLDYWGEGQDANTVWEHWLCNWMWYGSFPPYPGGHEFEGNPNVEGFRSTTRNLLRLAAAIEEKENAKKQNAGSLPEIQFPAGAPVEA